MSEILKITGDNTPTLFSERFNAHYHSVHGAMTETQVVFIDAGLKYVAENLQHIKILEIGFGTGLNCFATLLKSNELCLKIDFTTIEKYPVQPEISEKFMSDLNISEEERNLYRQMHNSLWNEPYKVNQDFQLTKLQMDFFELQLAGAFNLIYFDAFAPETQPELWTVEMFELMYRSIE